MVQPPIEPPVFRWIKTDCGRAQYTELAARPGPLADPTAPDQGDS